MPGDNPRCGFFWLSMSYLCGTIFLLTSKHLLTLLPQDVFIVWWYFLGLIYHIAYGLRTPSIAIENISHKDHRLLILYAACDLAGTVGMFSAIRLMDPGVVSFLSQLQMIFIALFGYLFLGEVFRRREIGAAVVIVAGVVLMSYRSPQVPLNGGVAVMVFNVCGAMGFVLVRRMSGAVGTLTMARLRALVLFAAFFVLNMFESGRIHLPSLPVIGLLAAGSLFGPFLNTISVFNTIKNIPVGKVGLFRSIQPLFVTVAVWVVFGSFPGVRELAGGLVMIAGSGLLAYFHAGHALTIRWPLRGIRG